MNDPQVRANNETLVKSLTSNDAYLQKEAQTGVNDYLRIRAKEDGFLRKIIPPVPVTPSDFDRQVDTVKPVIVKDMEPNSPAAVTIPFGTAPMNYYMIAPRYRVMFDRIVSQRFTADVANLMTYDMDIRQVFNDLMLKDILAEEDRKMIVAADATLDPNSTPGDKTTTRFTDVGACGYIRTGAMTRTTLANAMKGLPSTNRHLNAAVALINNITILDVVALGRDAVGGDLAEQMFTRGFAQKEVMGLQWFITIKTDLVPTNVMYQFSSPEYLGDCYLVEDITVATKHELWFFEMVAYEMLGATLKNSAAFCKSIFSGAAQDWVTG